MENNSFGPDKKCKPQRETSVAKRKRQPGLRTEQSLGTMSEDNNADKFIKVWRG